MRPVKLTAVTVLALLGAATVAYASSQFTQTANVTLTARKAGAATGLKVALLSADPGAVQPQGLKTLTITLPTGTKFNFKSTAVKECKASEVEIKATLGGACSAKAKIGTGTAVADGAPVLPTIPENVAAFVGKGQILFLLTPAAAAGQTLLLRGAVAKNKVTTNVPVINAGGLNIVITALDLTVKTSGHGSNAFITAGKCAKGAFTVKSHFLYQTGASLTLTSSSKCTA